MRYKNPRKEDDELQALAEKLDKLNKRGVITLSVYKTKVKRQAREIR